MKSKEIEEFVERSERKVLFARCCVEKTLSTAERVGENCEGGLLCCT